jgi:tetratricopeptide (TPR) repeat protein
MADVEQAIRWQDQYAAAYELRGVVQRKQGEVGNAIASFKQAARLFLEQQDADSARRCLAKLESLQPRSSPTGSDPVLSQTLRSEPDYFNRLLTQAQGGDTQQALADVNWILQVDAQDGKAYCCRGILQAKQARYEAAIADFNQALRYQFQGAIVYRNRGKARLQLGDPQGAIADFNQALKLEPGSGESYVSRGRAYQGIGHHLGAIEDYTQALELDPGNAHTYYARGLTHLQLEEKLLAIADLQRAISLFCEQEDWTHHQQAVATLKQIHSPSPPTPASLYGRLRQQLLVLVGGQWAIAERLIRQTKAQYPGRSQEWYLETVIDKLERDRR